ncbi:MAG TPA: prepilin-type N-terminal cleavage/methylation domain-containing protein [Candidatus Acidoferrales bacterium]|nr:prepilin-type N-terminal cleavage/methylation domain-containing protein [Candidatus Acidoferrales bacterium]
MKIGHGKRGFTLIELLIVVAIILIIMAIAIPNLMRSKMLANEAAAVGSLRTIFTAATTYSATYGNGYPPSLAALGPPAGGGNNSSCDTSNLLDSALATGHKTGYNYTYTGSNPVSAPAQGCSTPGFNSYTINADPITRGTTGQRSFFTDPSGTIRYNTTQPATATDAPIGG